MTTTRWPLRPTTIVWGLFTCAIGVLLLVIGSGVRLSVFTLIILALAAMGAAALLLAVLPRPKARVQVSAPEVIEGVSEIFEPHATGEEPHQPD